MVGTSHRLITGRVLRVAGQRVIPYLENITAARYVLLKLIKLTLSGLELSVQMAEKTMTMQGMCESLYQTATAMTTSIEIAEKVAEEVNEEIEGLDALSAYIEKVLARVKITLLDTVLRVESEKGDTKIELRKVIFLR